MEKTKKKKKGNYDDLFVFGAEFVELSLSFVQLMFVFLLQFFQRHFPLPVDLLTVVARRGQGRFQISIDTAVRLDLRRERERRKDQYEGTERERERRANLVFHCLVLLLHRLELFLQLIALLDDLFHLLEKVLFPLSKITLQFDNGVVERLEKDGVVVLP